MLRTLREIVKILPNVAKTRWSKKTDFYSLFVLLGKYPDKFPLSESERAEKRAILLSFAEEVDRFVKVEKEEGDLSGSSEEVKQYALNLRASSDLGARRKREDALKAILKLDGE